LYVRVNGDQADLVRNEREALVRTVPLGEVEAIVLGMEETDTVCMAVCTHCGAVHMFTGISVIGAFICRECGEGVMGQHPRSVNSVAPTA